jgi:DNA polymerase V
MEIPVMPQLNQEANICDIYNADCSTRCVLSLHRTPAKAGFPSPASDHIEGNLDLNTYLIKHPAATSFMRTEGDSMAPAGIHSGDLLIVDRSLNFAPGKVVIAAVNGTLLIKRLQLINGQLCLVSANPAYAPIPILEESECFIWGVVTTSIHQL